MVYPVKTDNDSDTQAFQNITTLNATRVDAAPPRESTDYQPLSYDVSGVGGYRLETTSRPKAIRQEVHDALLEQSLEEYEDLWRSLAQK
jgi:hypothetical protein